VTCAVGAMAVVAVAEEVVVVHLWLFVVWRKTNTYVVGVSPVRGGDLAGVGRVTFGGRGAIQTSKIAFHVVICPEMAEKVLSPL
jgi:hypothetical protein